MSRYILIKSVLIVCLIPSSIIYTEINIEAKSREINYISTKEIPIYKIENNTGIDDYIVEILDEENIVDTNYIGNLIRTVGSRECIEIKLIDINLIDYGATNYIEVEYQYTLDNNEKIIQSSEIKKLY